MYKTVRKGDASLQYTILPQTDQFSSSGFPQTSGKTRSRIIKYTMGTLMVLITMSCVATPFLIHQNDHNLFASTTLAMSRDETVRNVASRNQTKDIGASKNRSRTLTTTVPTAEVTKSKDLEDGTTSFGGILTSSGEEEETIVDDATLTDTPEEFSTQRSPRGTEAPTSVRQTSSATTGALPPTTTLSASATTAPRTLSSSTTTESARTASSGTRKPRMRVTLKLRENETIPQMYMKAGIASYKKGNITTSVLAHGLSLEGLIFKTPEGTIKPWPQKWFFSDPSADFHDWKDSTQMPVTIYIVLAGLAALASISIILMFYVQRKASRRQRPSIEEPEVEEHEEDKSTLLGAESQEAEEKE